MKYREFSCENRFPSVGTFILMTRVDSILDVRHGKVPRSRGPCAARLTQPTLYSPAFTCSEARQTSN